MKIAIAGGTGLVGSHVVSHLEEGGHQPVVLSRGRGVDLVTGEGLDEALVGVEAVIDVSNVTTQSRKTSIAFFAAATSGLLAAEERAGVGHHVVLSIVGVDRVDLGYYAGKREQERLVTKAVVPWTILRATQFHEFADQVLAHVPGPFAVVPRMRTQPIAAVEVAAALAEIATSEPLGMAPELAGPREENLADMARQILRSRGERRSVLSLRLPMKGAGAVAAGGLLPRNDGPRGHQTFKAWLAAQKP
jgi:uncharacterized protein YbjT (DUF2867 family)